MRINARMKIRNWTLFLMLSKTQTLEGIDSIVDKKTHEHIIFWDLENCDLIECKTALRLVQSKYDLGNIYVFSDYPRSYRAICFSHVKFKEYLRILLDTMYLDYNFYFWTVQRSAGTIRLSNKKGRAKNKCVAVIYNFQTRRKTEIPRKLNKIVYDTGIDKKGVLLRLG